VSVKSSKRSRWRKEKVRGDDLAGERVRGCHGNKAKRLVGNAAAGAIRHLFYGSRPDGQGAGRRADLAVLASS